jgi:chromosome segregation ATPase
VNVIVYANYGEPNARIIHGRDHDFPDLRTHEQNRLVAQRIQALAADARSLIQEAESRLVRRIKALISEYHHTRSEAIKKEFEQANATFPFLFSRAWSELRQERARPAAAGGTAALVARSVVDEEPIPVDVVYPLDTALREQVLEIERMIEELNRDLESLRAHGRADDILVQTCRKLTARAEENLRRQDGSDFNARRLEMTRASLLTTWKQVRSRLPR